MIQICLPLSGVIPKNLHGKRIEQLRDEELQQACVSAAAWGLWWKVERAAWMEAIVRGLLRTMDVPDRCLSTVRSLLANGAYCAGPYNGNKNRVAKLNEEIEWLNQSRRFQAPPEPPKKSYPFTCLVCGQPGIAENRNLRKVHPGNCANRHLLYRVRLRREKKGLALWAWETPSGTFLAFARDFFHAKEIAQKHVGGENWEEKACPEWLDRPAQFISIPAILSFPGRATEIKLFEYRTKITDIPSSYRKRHYTDPDLLESF